MRAAPKGMGFGLKTGIDFAHFGLESGMVFEETNSKRIRKKEKYANST